MPKTPRTAPIVRKTRADAQRNRERILDVAREAFTERGADASLDEIARRAELGPGTLYRHFPTRDALIEAVYRSEVEKLTSAAGRLTATLTPLEALRSWMLMMVDYVARKMLILPAMETLPGGSTRLVEGSYGPIQGTFRGLVKLAVRSGDLRAGTNPDDILRALIGLFYTTSMPGWEQSARRLVGILIEGSRRTER